MEESLTTEGPKRPQFLTILCILSYIGVGFGVVGSIVGWWSMRAMSSMMDVAGGMEGMEEMGAFPGMEEAMAQLKYINITTSVNIIASLICLVGVLQMWKLKKMGFYIYVVGEVVPFIVSAVLMGGTAFGAMAVVMGAVVPGVFIGLYTMNLKHMS